jgi:hypothetical protein
MGPRACPAGEISSGDYSGLEKQPIDRNVNRRRQYPGINRLRFFRPQNRDGVLFGFNHKQVARLMRIQSTPWSSGMKSDALTPEMMQVPPLRASGPPMAA